MDNPYWRVDALVVKVNPVPTVGVMNEGSADAPAPTNNCPALPGPTAITGFEASPTKTACAAKGATVSEPPTTILPLVLSVLAALLYK